MQTSALDAAKKNSNEQDELNNPLVSIGVPVYNGESFLRTALELLINQTYKNIEIIISDNNSSDKSSEIIREFASIDSRIQVYTQGKTISAFGNFRFVFEKSKGNYFMWAACDDRRSLDYVEGLLETLKITPNASISFGKIALFSDDSLWKNSVPIDYAFETTANEAWMIRLRRYTRMNCLHIYGLIRADALKAYRWYDLDHGPDILLLVHLSLLGEFVRTKRGCFFYFAPEKEKTPQKRALVNSLRPLKPFREVRLSWACALAAHNAGKYRSTQIPSILAFIITYLNRHWRWLKPWLFNNSPRWVVSAYRKWIKRTYA